MCAAHDSLGDQLGNNFSSSELLCTETRAFSKNTSRWLISAQGIRSTCHCWGPQCNETKVGAGENPRARMHGAKTAHSYRKRTVAHHRWMELTAGKQEGPSVTAMTNTGADPWASGSKRKARMGLQTAGNLAFVTKHNSNADFDEPAAVLGQDRCAQQVLCSLLCKMFSPISQLVVPHKQILLPPILFLPPKALTSLTVPSPSNSCQHNSQHLKMPQAMGCNADLSVCKSRQGEKVGINCSGFFGPRMSCKGSTDSCKRGCETQEVSQELQHHGLTPGASQHCCLLSLNTRWNPSYLSGATGVSQETNCVKKNTGLRKYLLFCGMFSA